jgi:hypothetical protein
MVICNGKTHMSSAENIAPTNPTLISQKLAHAHGMRNEMTGSH